MDQRRRKKEIDRVKRFRKNKERETTINVQ
jgi:hypothetical protein